MAAYFKTKKLDISAGNPLIVIVNTKDAHEQGLHQGSKGHLCWKDLCLYVAIDFSDSIVQPGEIGMYCEVWDKYDIPADDIVSLDIPEPSHSTDIIRKKIKGKKLSYEEIKQVMEDIAKRRLSTIEITYFASTYYNPGFDDEEVGYLTKAMAETGDVLDFTNGDPNMKVVDKHSIGGIPAKGVTPVLVPIIASFGLTIPNTSTRSITTPAGTSDMLEVVMPVTLNKDEIIKVVKQEGACLVWGGGIDLAPADDVMIAIERPLNMESYDKLLVSIIAKKMAMKITHLVIDIPYGKGAKVPDLKGVVEIENEFERLCGGFGIDVEIYKRESLGPDGYGIGPALEIRDVLRIFERHTDRPQVLEALIIDMAGRLLELSGTAQPGQGAKMARSKIENSEAEKKFWSIAKAQGAKGKIKSSEIMVGEYSYTYKSKRTGMISRIGNREVVEIARALGAPFIKEAGMYFHKLKDDHVKAGEPLFTLYASSAERLGVGKEVVKRCGDFVTY
ncbi:MAG: thymidine phosphorylase [Patescibacteria group bacterium]|nr:thymidine phosphorylase [Patescibacteria group bacterium]